MITLRQPYYLTFLIFLLSQASGADHKKGKNRKPEAGQKDCEWYLAGEDVNGAWDHVLLRDCKLDSVNKTIKEPSKSHSNLVDLYDPCCTEYIGLQCQPSYAGHHEGYCGFPDPYKKHAAMGRHKFLQSVMKKKLDDGQQLDEDRWEAIR